MRWNYLNLFQVGGCSGWFERMTLPVTCGSAAYLCSRDMLKLCRWHLLLTVHYGRNDQVTETSTMNW